MRRRRLTATQRAIAEDAIQFCEPAVASFRRKNPDLRRAMRRMDLMGVAYAAICAAALTYDPKRSQPTTYFGSAIRYALYREVLLQRRTDARFVPVEQVRISTTDYAGAHLMSQRGLRSLRRLPARQRCLLEDRIIYGISLQQLAKDHQTDKRTIAREITEAVRLLRLAESDLA